MRNKKNKSAADDVDDDKSGRGYPRRWGLQMLETVGMSGMSGILGILGMLRFQECQDQVLYLFGTTRIFRFCMVVDWECL